MLVRFAAKSGQLPWTIASAIVGSAATLCLAPAGLGCAAAGNPSNTAYRLAVRYDVEPASIGLDRVERSERIKTELTRAGELGFDAVIFEHVEDNERGEMLEAASRCGMVAAVPDRNVQYYLLTGRLPRGYTSVEALLRAKLRGLSGRRGFAGLSIGRIPQTRDAGDRLRRTMAAAGELGVPCAVLDGSSVSATAGAGLAVVDSGDLAGVVTAPRRELGGRSPPHPSAGQDPADDLSDSPLERLLARYHGELAAGRTGGLLVDRFARAPGERVGLVTVDDTPSAAKLAAVQGLLGRARRWGPRLCGFRSEVLKEASSGGGDGISLTVFSQGPRRYVLAYNPSPERYVRGSVAVPASIGGRPVARLVEVPPTADLVAGNVFESQRGGVVIRVDLRPGDAALFEVF